MSIVATEEEVLQYMEDFDFLTEKVGLTVPEIGKRVGLARPGYLTLARTGEAAPSRRTVRVVRSLAESLASQATTGNGVREPEPQEAQPAPAQEKEGRGARVESGTTAELVERSKMYLTRAIRVLEKAEAQAAGLWRPGIRSVREKLEAAHAEFGE